LLILAYQRAPAATLTPYLYAQIGFAMLGGWIVFSHVPDRSRCLALPGGRLWRRGGLADCA
jgi:drug/metabolite transporter (DMT)-like permease